MAVPACINFYWLKKAKVKVLFFSLITTFLFAPPIELISRMANAWDVSSIFLRPFGLIPVENILFAFLNFFWVLCFYEYFFDTEKKVFDISKRFKYLVVLYILLSLSVYFLFFTNSSILATDYYLVALIFLLPTLLFLGLKFPKVFKKSLFVTAFFALVFLFYEAVSMSVGHWWWPGNYLLPVKISGMIFPIDDIIIWYFFSTPALILGYEFFVDDNK
ncbi:MAG: hypothetical protein K9M44_03080 [Candidatus Pacebacteria bacterium]|nr:hypothetical protein [Candidatus Paceibacterota bacterium]